jgi:hypothetical protein
MWVTEWSRVSLKRQQGHIPNKMVALIRTARKKGKDMNGFENALTGDSPRFASH